MGQAKARGNKDQRVAEAVERERVRAAAAEVRWAAARKEEAEALAAVQVAREKENAERRERGETPLPRRTARNNRMHVQSLIAVAALSLAYR